MERLAEEDPEGSEIVGKGQGEDVSCRAGGERGPGVTELATRVLGAIFVSAPSSMLLQGVEAGEGAAGGGDDGEEEALAARLTGRRV